MAGDRVVIYGTDSCPYTTSAREDFAQRGFEVDYVDVKADPDKLDAMIELAVVCAPRIKSCVPRFS